MNRGLLLKTVKCVASMEGWAVGIEKKYVQCNRSGYPRRKKKNDNESCFAEIEESSRVKKGGILKCGCTWKIKLSALHKKDEPVKRTKGDDWDKMIQVVDSTVIHRKPCIPSVQNRVMAGQRAGLYNRSIPLDLIFSMCNVIDRGDILSNTHIKNLLKARVLSQKQIDSQFIYNLRVKLVRLLPEYRDTNRDYAIFKERISAEEVMQGLDNQPDVNEDEAYLIAQQTWLEICKSSSSQSEMLFSFKQYLKLIQSRAKGFHIKFVETMHNHHLTTWSKN